MRSGPATRTAFCQREFRVIPFDTAKGCLIRALRQLRSIRRLTTLFEANPELRSACAPEGAPRPITSAGCSPAMRDRSLRRPQRPGRPQRFHVWEPLGSASLRLSVRSGFAACSDFGPWENCRRTDFRNHWQRYVHACSDCNFSHSGTFSNENSHPRCAKTVECGNSLWKNAENPAEIPGHLIYRWASAGPSS
jgi:hypothetical protein